MSEPALICDNPQCRVADDGRCVDGLSFDECTHFGHAPAAAAEEPAGQEVAGIVLSQADRLSSAAAGRIARRGESRIIAILGTSQAGKTSLVAALFDLFQQGPVGGITFARSSTLHALEIACHDARAVSRRTVPHSRRTPRGTVMFFHLAVASEGRLLNLLLGDRAGEDYTDLTDDVRTAAGYEEVRRADTLTVLVDGARLISNADRHNHLSEVDLMLRALKDGGALSERSRLAIVLTKLDQVRGTDKKSRVLSDFDRLCDGIRNHYVEDFEEIFEFPVAASPANDLAERGEGLEALLKFWLGTSQFCYDVEIAEANVVRAIDRLSATSS